jgi:hypothetical protein
LTGDDGFTLFGGGREKGEDSLPINRFLWQASLDVLSFIPLASTDPFGGVILTEWTTLAEAPNERLKLTVYITSSELRSDAVRVSVFRQKRQGNKADGAWQDAASDPKTASDLENAILTRARELRVAAAYDKWQGQAVTVGMTTAAERYDFTAAEPRWQDAWHAAGCFTRDHLMPLSRNFMCWRCSLSLWQNSYGACSQLCLWRCAGALQTRRRA